MLPTAAAVLAASVALVPTGPAQMTTARAEAIAAAAWGNPCGGRVALTRGPLPGAYTAEAVPETCSIELTDRILPWPLLCSTIVHEFGHLAGYGHAPASSRSIMAPAQPRTWKYCLPRRLWSSATWRGASTLDRYAPVGSRVSE